MKTNEVFLYLYMRDKAFTTDDRLAQCAAGYAASRGLPAPSSWELSREAGKKPVFAHTDALHFSVSHSGRVWACALSAFPVGLDVQLRRSCRMEAIARRFFHPDERAHLEQNGYTDFFPLWAAKESYVKYTGEGVARSFSRFSVADGRGLAGEVDGAALIQLPLSPAYGRGALCLCGRNIDGLRVIERY